MAEKKPVKKVRGADSNSKEVKKKATLRERNLKAAAAKDRPKRIRKVATTAVVNPASKLRKILTSEYHIFPRKNEPGFFNKSRKITPSYVVKSASELKNVTWPGRRETWRLVFAVFVFSISIGIFISLLDFGLEKLFREVIL